MFVINDDQSIYVTRGDALSFQVAAEKNGVAYTFVPGDILRLKVSSRKDCKCVVLSKDFSVAASSATVDISLTGQETKIGDIVSKPTDYWYEVELNPDTYPQTIIGYDEDGAKVFRLFPEARDMTGEDLEEKDIPWVDTEMSGTSTRPVQNRVITAEINKLRESMNDLDGVVKYKAQTLANEEKAQARTNIGAASHAELNTALSGMNESVSKVNERLDEANERLDQSVLPSVTEADNGKIPMVVNGAYEMADCPSGPTFETFTVMIQPESWEQVYHGDAGDARYQYLWDFPATEDNNGHDASIIEVGLEMDAPAGYTNYKEICEEAARTGVLCNRADRWYLQFVCMYDKPTIMLAFNVKLTKYGTLSYNYNEAEMSMTIMEGE